MNSATKSRGATEIAETCVGRLMAMALTLMPLALMQASAAEPYFPVQNISVAEQNEMMDKYCSICHRDAAQNGGLSLEHFDAAKVSPPLAAMLVSKFTTGVPLEKIMQPEIDQATADEIEEGKKRGAPSVMGIAGLPLPTEGEINGFIMAMARRSSGAELWHIVNDADEITADIARVTPSYTFDGKRDSTFRLALHCNTASGEGEIVLSWSPIPVNGQFEAVIDGGLPLVYALNEREAMANGDPGTSSPSSVVLFGPGKRSEQPTLYMPRTSLRINGPLPNEQVEFSFSDLEESDRKALTSCFGR